MSDLMMTRLTTVRPKAGQAVAHHAVPWLRLAFRTYLTRQALAELSPRDMADIGVSSTAAASEAARLPWDTNPGPRRPGRGVLAAIQRFLERSRSRRMLSHMSVRELRDIGLTPPTARIEATKFFWQY
jgi:uncharacterized protein YjiS (DUF1127 family)